VRPATVCIWARWIPVALDALQGTGTPVCAVANFPNGAANPSAAAAETAAAVAAGATEVDVVFPYRAMLAGDLQVGLQLVRACRESCGEHALLKVILETGQLPKAEDIRQAAELAIDGGAHFLKNSTSRNARSGHRPFGSDRGGSPTRSVHRLQGFRRHSHDGGRLGLSHAL
jgi:deoxyribose-phosphate aldolase